MGSCHVLLAVEMKANEEDDTSPFQIPLKLTSDSMWRICLLRLNLLRPKQRDSGEANKWGGEREKKGNGICVCFGDGWVD